MASKLKSGNLSNSSGKRNSLIAESKRARRVEEALIDPEQTAREKVLLKEILQAKKTNQIKGIYGRMGDLGAIDAKYDVAISTACPGLDYILVETADVAQKCIDLVLKKNLGNATFLILEKLERHRDQLKRKENTPEDVPRLFDLIQVNDERLKLGFYELTRDTLVARDLKQAFRVASKCDKEFKVVTLEGALYDFSKPCRGKMGTLIRGDIVTEVANVAKELSALRINPSLEAASEEREERNSEEPKEEVIELEEEEILIMIDDALAKVSSVAHEARGILKRSLQS